MLDLTRLTAAYEKAKADLLAERTPDGHWIGELSSSALATATAVSALAMVRGAGWDKAAAAAGPPSAAGTVGLRSQGELVPPYEIDDLIHRGVSYLIAQQNDDGGFGDTDLSHSNIATTYLVVAALHLAENAVGNALRGVPDWASQRDSLLRRANAYIDAKGRLDGLRKRYGIDKTFVVPIMTNLALAGLVDWKEIDPLPFELACVPQSWYRFMGMPVVSYAIPALVAIGQARYFHAPPWNPFTRLLRWLSITRSLKVLRRMQPESGGYLEATPLTSFVVMSLAGIQCGPLAPRVDNQAGAPKRETSLDRPATSLGNSRSELPTLRHSLADDVIRSGVQFLINSVRPDGSWPIDTNLATWNTTLAINALAGAGEDVAELLSAKPRPLVAVSGSTLHERTEEPEIAAVNAHAGKPHSATTGRGFGSVLDWLLSCQHTKRHPFTGADPGGFGWSDLSGAVPDADDTPGAVLAISYFIKWKNNRDDARYIWRQKQISRHCDIVENAEAWLLKLQNRDGGWPTFCRGWGRLPFDRSGVDLTAHALRAFAFESITIDGLTIDDLENDGIPIDSALGFINVNQHPDGSWSPLWFGNQDHLEEDNPVYGTAKVLMAYRDLGLMDSPEAKRGVAWLVASQNEDGGWGSGVWDRLRIADCGLRIGEDAERAAAVGVESGESVTGSAPADHSVLGTQYSVPGTGSEASTMSNMPTKSNSRSPQRAHAPRSPNPKSKIQNLKSSVEETALAVEALLAACPRNAAEGVPYSGVARGLAWLIERVEAGQHRQPAPIGFYFAKLWYYEKLYPLTFTVAALGRACRQFAHPEQPDSHAEPAPSSAP